MDASFWHDKWELGQTGFHQSKANTLLVRHLDSLQLDLEQKDKARIFLPLCGKTLDISYLLGLGCQVVGVELSELAIKQLFQALDITPTVTVEKNFIRYQSENIDIFIGDFFDLSREQLGHVDAVYDRAALIALPKDLRQRYTKHLCTLTHAITQLLICVEYDQTQMKGPPFSVDATAVRRYYEGVYSLECIESNEIIGGLKKQAAANETVWVLKTRDIEKRSNVRTNL